MFEDTILILQLDVLLLPIYFGRAREAKLEKG